MNNLNSYKQDLKNLITLGDKLYLSMFCDCYPEKKENYKQKLISFNEHYQEWYTESLLLLIQLLPDRVVDFKKYYEKPNNRKEIQCDNYVIQDYLQDIIVRSGMGEIIVEKKSAIFQFQQQLNILKSVQKRFESALFDIKQLTQADIFDSELDSAKELNKKGFSRGAGAISGVVLEKHLAQVCSNHKIKISKKNPSIADFNDKLKKAEVYDTPLWRKIQHLGDIRNLCDHNKTKDPEKQDVEELIMGVDKIIKTVF